MKRALILGITGNFGSQMGKALLEDGWEVCALMRDPEKAPVWLKKPNIIQGDAMNKDDVKMACTGIELIVYAANPPYHQWQQLAMNMLEPCLLVAQDQGLRVLFPGNVYNYAPSKAVIDENCAQQPVSAKGKIRLAMEKRLELASRSGASITIIRAGDFIGPEAHATWLDHMLKSKGTTWKLSLPHDENHVHFWSYLPDLCRNAVKIVSKSSQRFEQWHDAGLKLGQRDWEEGFSKLGLKLELGRLPWRLLRVLSWVNPMMREVILMCYLWQQPVILDGRKMVKALGEDYNSTPFEQVLAAVLNSKSATNGVTTKSSGNDTNPGKLASARN